MTAPTERSLARMEVDIVRWQQGQMSAHQGRVKAQRTTRGEGCERYGMAKYGRDRCRL